MRRTKLLQCHLKRSTIGGGSALDDIVQYTVALKWSGMRSNVYCRWVLGALRFKGALNYVFIHHLDCLFSTVCAPQITAAIITQHVLRCGKVLLASSSLLSTSSIVFFFFFFYYLEMNLVWGVMIQSEHCSLHGCNAISTVLRSDEGVWLGRAKPEFWCPCDHLCSVLLLLSENSDMFLLDLIHFTPDLAGKRQSCNFKLSVWTLSDVSYSSVSTDL